jgi:hypothetical protein
MVSDCVHENWGTVFKMNVLEFLNIICFILDDAREEKRRQDEYKRRLKI